MHIKRNSRTKFLLLCLLLLLSMNSNAKTITCGLKKVTIQGDKITKIVHEDGTVHTGSTVSKWWKYDGKSIKHKLLGELLPCTSKPKTRNEVVTELSLRFTKKPKLYGMNRQEGKLMTSYTASLMKANNECYLLVDAVKLSSRKGMFYIDCNNKLSKTKRYWISKKELEQGKIKNVTSPISRNSAKTICNQELKKGASNPSTYKPSLILGTTSRIIERTGRNVVEIEFEASNSFGVKGKYTGRCILEGGTLIEVTAQKR